LWFEKHDQEEEGEADNNKNRNILVSNTHFVPMSSGASINTHVAQSTIFVVVAQQIVQKHTMQMNALEHFLLLRGILAFQTFATSRLGQMKLVFPFSACLP